MLSNCLKTKYDVVQELPLREAHAWFIRFALNPACSVLACGAVDGHVRIWAPQDGSSDPRRIVRCTSANPSQNMTVRTVTTAASASEKHDPVSASTTRRHHILQPIAQVLQPFTHDFPCRCARLQSPLMATPYWHAAKTPLSGALRRCQTQRKPPDSNFAACLPAAVP